VPLEPASGGALSGSLCDRHDCGASGRNGSRLARRGDLTWDGDTCLSAETRPSPVATGDATGPPTPIFLEVLILGSLKSKFAEVLIIVDFNWPLMSEIQNAHEFLEVLILNGLKYQLSSL
jgi:hypothetical protein